MFTQPYCSVLLKSSGLATTYSGGSLLSIMQLCKSTNYTNASNSSFWYRLELVSVSSVAVQHYVCHTVCVTYPVLYCNVGPLQIVCSKDFH